MNIEQIKKDWEQHCKDYGATPITQDIFRNITLTIKECKQNEIIVRYDGISFLIEKHNYYKLFTTFYEKLMEASDE